MMGNMMGSLETASYPSADGLVAYPDTELRDLIPEFLKNRRTELPVLESLLNQQDFDGLRRIGHTLKGVCASFGFPHLGQLGAQMEQTASSKLQAETASIVSQIKHYVENVKVIFRDEESHA